VSLGLVVPALPGVRHFVAPGTPHLFAVLIPAAAATAAAACIGLFGRFPRAAVVACCIVVAADGALSFGAFFEWRHSPTPAAARTLYSADDAPPWGGVATRTGGINRFLFVGRESQAMYPYFPQVTDSKRLLSASGYEPLLSQRYADALGGMVDSGWIHRPGQFLRRRSWLLDLLRVSTVLAPRAQAPRTPPAWFDHASRVGNLVRYTYTPRLPGAFVIGKVRPVDGDEALNLAIAGTGFDPRRSVLVEQTCDICRSMTAGGFAGRVTRVHRSDNSITLDVEARRPAMLVVSESWFPGWSAVVDQASAGVVRADAVALGVPLPAGRHHVELTYHPPGFTLGAAISGGAVLSIIAAAALLRERRRRRAK
jgi:Bacterial membrane protein YfhO